MALGAHGRRRALWGLYVYIENERSAEAARLVQAERDNATRRIEAQKPYLQLQFETYLKTMKLVGRMIQFQPEQDEYKAMRKDFDTLYWTELALVEDTNVAAGMVQLEVALSLYERSVGPQADIKRAALGLAHAMRDSIQNGWQGMSPNLGAVQK